MNQSVALRCRCGSMRGVASGVSAESQRRAICYCADCQQYALFLEREDVLDSHGGTDAIMLTHKQLTLSQGSEQLCCVRLGPKGLLRWYAGCCNTPIANTVAPHLPFAILVRSFVDQPEDTLDAAFGKPAMRINAESARGTLTEPAAKKVPLSFLPRLLGRLLGGWLTGATRPSPFYEAGLPRTPPRVLAREEREALRERLARAQALAT